MIVRDGFLRNETARSLRNPVFPEPADQMPDFVCLRSRDLLKLLLKLNTKKATGPDNISAVLLRELANEICVPLVRICRLLLKHGIWPEAWKLHNLVPIFKKGTVYTPLNYRGVHLTSVLSKVAERFIGRPFLRYCDTHHLFGPRQWPYQKQRSSKDLLTFLMCFWLLSACRGFCVGTYLGDIAGAFDRVSTVLLLLRLYSIGSGRTYLIFFKAFLVPRVGRVCVQGTLSDPFVLKDQVFQGTVLGPPLWKLFLFKYFAEYKWLGACFCRRFEFVPTFQSHVFGPTHQERVGEEA